MSVLHNNVSEGTPAQDKPRKGRKRILLVCVLIVILAALGFGGYAIKQKIDREQRIAEMQSVVDINTFYDGIVLDRVILDGMTLEKAREIIGQKVNDQMDKLTVSLSYNGQTWTFSHEDMDARSDWEEKLEEAYNVGRSGDLEDRYQRVMGLREKGMTLDSELTYDVGLLRGDVQTIADQINKQAVDATIQFSPDDETQFTFTDEKTGLYLDAKQVMEAIKEKVDSAVYGEIALEPADVLPRIYRKDLEKLTHRVVQFSTNLLKSTEQRAHNVTFALSKVNGYRLDPGQVFSFNEVVGPRTLKAGFEMAPVIMPDKSLQDGEGGGVCQSSTTLYNAALRADLEILERYHHSFPVSYIDIGLDASVTYGGADLKFRNNRETPVFIRTYTKDRDVFVEIYGAPLADSDEIRCYSEIKETIDAPKAKEIEDTEGKYAKKPGDRKVHVVSKPGYKVVSYKDYYKGGEKINTEVIVNDYYRPIKGIIYYKPAPSPDTGNDEIELQIQPDALMQE